MGPFELFDSQSSPKAIADRAMLLLSDDQIEPSVSEDLIRMMREEHYVTEYDDLTRQWFVRSQMTGNLETVEDFSRRVLFLIHRHKIKEAVDTHQTQVH